MTRFPAGEYPSGSPGSDVPRLGWRPRLGDTCSGVQTVPGMRHRNSPTHRPRSTTYTSALRLLGLASVTLLTVLTGMSAAHAHMGVAESNPANGTEIAVAPEVFSVRFSIDVDLDTAEAQIRRIGGLDAPVSDMNRRDVDTESLSRLTGEGAGSEATFALPPLAAGLYAIDWSVQEIDGHVNNSMVLFKVTEGSASTGMSDGQTTTGVAPQGGDGSYGTDGTTEPQTTVGPGPDRADRTQPDDASSIPVLGIVSVAVAIAAVTIFALIRVRRTS
jgi:methionine-rich copper-binding protein CopC